MQQIAAADQLLVWDAVGEWCRTLKLEPIRAIGALHTLVTANIRQPVNVRAAWVGPITPRAFAAFCSLAWVWMRTRPRAVLVVEELADVTSPGKAPAAWGEIVRKHRKTGATVYALTQRPAE